MQVRKYFASNPTFLQQIFGQKGEPKEQNRPLQTNGNTSINAGNREAANGIEVANKKKKGKHVVIDETQNTVNKRAKKRKKFRDEKPRKVQAAVISEEYNPFRIGIPIWPSVWNPTTAIKYKMELARWERTKFQKERRRPRPTLEDIENWTRLKLALSKYNVETTTPNSLVQMIGPSNEVGKSSTSSSNETDTSFSSLDLSEMEI